MMFSTRHVSFLLGDMEMCGRCSDNTCDQEYGDEVLFHLESLLSGSEEGGLAVCSVWNQETNTNVLASTHLLPLSYRFLQFSAMLEMLVFRKNLLIVTFLTHISILLCKKPLASRKGPSALVTEQRPKSLFVRAGGFPPGQTRQNSGRRSHRRSLLHRDGPAGSA